MSDAHCHCCSCVVEVSAQRAYAYMSDGLRQSEWALGSLNRRGVGENLFVGTSLFDDSETYVRIEGDRRRMLVHYHVGPDPDSLEPRNVARIVPGEQLGRKAGTCVITLLAWRTVAMDDDRWKQLCLSHELEMYIIKSRLERRGTE